jgi:hypothetical protein
MGKTRDWPTDLRKRINFPQSQVHDDLVAEYIIESQRRIRLLFDFLGIDPKMPGSWEYLIVQLCNHWGIPGFHDRGRGAPKRWTDTKNCQLFADVMALTLTSRMPEHAACVYISKHPAKYDQRYADFKTATIHRQFLRAKKQIKSDPIFRNLHFNLGLVQVPIEYGSGLIKVAVNLYACRNKKRRNGA